MSNSDILGSLAVLLAGANDDAAASVPQRASMAKARERLCAALGIERNDEQPDRIRVRLDLALNGQDWPPDMADERVLRGREMAAAENDPEMLTSVDRLYYAAWLLRANHRVIDDDWLMWGNLAEQLEWAANIPQRTGVTPMPWREFNRLADLASGIIRVQDTHTPTRRKLLRWVNERRVS
jgi:hypothetical protein